MRSHTNIQQYSLAEVWELVTDRTKTVYLPLNHLQSIEILNTDSNISTRDIGDLSMLGQLSRPQPRLSLSVPISQESPSTEY